MLVVFQNVNTEYNYINVISIISKSFFLIAKLNLTYPFLNFQQVTGTNWKYIQEGFIMIIIHVGVVSLATGKILVWPTD